jgi:ribosomal protein L11 methyltransferase
MNCRYLQFAIHPADCDITSAHLWDLGTQGLQELNSTSIQVHLKAFFPGEAPIRQVRQMFLNRCRQSNIQVQAMTTGIEKDEDWLEKWRSSLKPFPLGRHFFMIPSESEIVRIPPKRIPIWLEPGMAFGTGTHETTQLCLKAIERWLQPEDKLLDVGTGSGILAMAASKLGAGTTVACDIDPIALEVAKTNAIRNQCPTALEWILGDIRSVGRRRFDLVVANLATNIIEENFTLLERCVKSSGRLILSGILGVQAKRIRAKLNGSSFNLEQMKRNGEWICFILQKKSGPNLPPDRKR